VDGSARQAQRLQGRARHRADLRAQRHLAYAIDAGDPPPGDQEPRPLVCVEAGIRLRAPNLALDDRGLAMFSLGGSQGQTVAGATSTSTHGGDIDLRPVCDLIRAVHLVTTEGREVWIESDSDPLTADDRLRAHVTCPDLEIRRDDRLLHAVQVGIGCFGIVYAVVLEVRAAFGLYEQSSKLSWSSVSSALTSGAGTAGPFQPLFDTLSAPNHDSIVGDPARPRFLEILLSSRSRGACQVRRRWETSAPVTVDHGEGGGEEIYYKPVGTSVILKTAASILRVIAGIVAPLPFWGAVRALEISKRALELDVMSLGEPVGGGEAIAIACEAIWWADDFGGRGARGAGARAQGPAALGPAEPAEGRSGPPAVRRLAARVALPPRADRRRLRSGLRQRLCGAARTGADRPGASGHRFRRSHGRIADLCDPESDWRVSVDEAIDDIDRGRVTYYIEPTPDADRNVIFARRVLTTEPDEIRENNLDDLPQQAHHDGLPPSAGFWRHVTSVERDEDGDTVFLNNDDEGWSVPRAVAWLEVSTETAAYYIEPTPPAERKELLALAYLTTAPDASAENNLGNLPEDSSGNAMIGSGWNRWA
jgi:Protein of unknown function (DUF3892)